VAVSCLLLIASGVLAHNGIALASIELAFDYRNMVVVDPQLYIGNLSSTAARQKLDALSARFSGLPDVEGVTSVTVPPLGGRAKIDNLPGLPRVYRNAVDPSYFRVMRLVVVRGRTFQPGERDAVIVSESAARAIWPDRDALGSVWRLAGAERTVVGVVQDSGANLVADAESIEAYLPMEDSAVTGGALILHTRGIHASLLHSLVATASDENETVSVTPMSVSRENVLDVYRRMVTVIGSIGAVATLLGAAGMFALVPFTVAQRTRELGIRIAIGARPVHILEALLRQNAWPTVMGTVAGLMLAGILSRLVRSMIPLQRQQAVDLVGFAAGLAAFATIALLATLSPALRALRIDPSTTLRED
jgi:macrolide transport system ATP-binding/permease protein